MKWKLLYSMIFVFIIVLAGKAGADTYINSCQLLDVINETYILTDNISAADDCFPRVAEGVTLDCNGYSIIGPGFGVAFGQYTAELSTGNWTPAAYLPDNVTLTNCVIKDFQVGVSALIPDSLTVENNWFENMEIGVNIQDKSGCNYGGTQSDPWTTANIVRHNTFVHISSHAVSFPFSDECVAKNRKCYAVVMENNFEMHPTQNATNGRMHNLAVSAVPSAIEEATDYTGDHYGLYYNINDNFWGHRSCAYEGFNSGNDAMAPLWGLVPFTAYAVAYGWSVGAAPFSDGVGGDCGCEEFDLKGLSLDSDADGNLDSDADNICDYEDRAEVLIEAPITDGTTIQICTDLSDPTPLINTGNISVIELVDQVWMDLGNLHVGYIGDGSNIIEIALKAGYLTGPKDPVIIDNGTQDIRYVGYDSWDPQWYQDPVNDQFAPGTWVTMPLTCDEFMDLVDTEGKNFLTGSLAYMPYVARCDDANCVHPPADPYFPCPCGGYVGHYGQLCVFNDLNNDEYWDEGEPYADLYINYWLYGVNNPLGTTEMYVNYNGLEELELPLATYTDGNLPGLVPTTGMQGSAYPAMFRVMLEADFYHYTETKRQFVLAGESNIRCSCNLACCIDRNGDDACVDGEDDFYWTIQEAIDALGNTDAFETIIVLSGMHDETLDIEGKLGLTIKGEDRDAVILKPGVSTYLEWGEGTHPTRHTVIRVVDSTLITIEDMTMDFQLVEVAPSSTYTSGVLYWESSGTVNHNVIKNLSRSDAGGYYHEFAVFVEAPTAPPTDYAYYEFALTSNDFQDAGRDALITKGYVNSYVYDNEISKTLDDMGYGIEIGSQSTSEIVENEISGFDTVAESDGSFSAGIYLPTAWTTGMSLSKPVSVANNEIYNCQYGLVARSYSTTYTGDIDMALTVTGNYVHDATMVNNSAVPNATGGFRLFDDASDNGSSLIGFFGNNRVENCGDYGYDLTTGSDNGHLEVAIEDERILDNDIGIGLYEFGTPSSTYVVSVHDSNIVGNADYGIKNDLTSCTIDAEDNWYGAVNGPYHYPSATGEGNPAAIGDRATDYVDYNPWRDAAFSFSKGGGGDPRTYNVCVDKDATAGCSAGDDTYNWVQYAIDDADSELYDIRILDGEYGSKGPGAAFEIDASPGRVITSDADDETKVTFKPFDTLVIGDCGGESRYATRETAIRVFDSEDAEFMELTMDFDLIKDLNRNGLYFCDSTGAYVHDNAIKNMSGSGVGEITLQFDAPSSTDSDRAELTVEKNVFTDTGRVGVCTHWYSDATIGPDNVFASPTDDFGYAIEIGGESTGEITGNTISGYDYREAVSEGEESAGIYIENCFTGPGYSNVTSSLTKDVSVSGNQVSGCEWALWIGNMYDGYAGNVDIVVNVTGNLFKDAAVSNVTTPSFKGGVKIVDEDKEHGSSVTATFVGNIVTNNGDYGYYLKTWGDGDIKATLNGESITHNGKGIYLTDSVGAGTGSDYDIRANHCNLCDNTIAGIHNAYSGTIINALINWWDAADGPGGYNPPVFDPVTGREALGAGDLVSSDVHWDPFMGEETSIDLVSFEAKGLDEMVRLSWETGSEPSNAGFNLWRSDSREGQYVKINGGLIPAEGDATHGAEYSFEDMDVTRGRTYYYKLEDVSIYGTSGFHGPVSAHVPLLESHGCGMVADTGGSASVFAVLFAAVFAISGARRLSRRRRPYRKPEFRTVSGDEVLKKLGPAQTCSPTPAQCPTSD